MTNKPSRVTFLDAHSAGPGLLGVLAFPEDYPPEKEYTMFLTTRADQWAQLQFEFDLVSVASLSRPAAGYYAWWLAGKRGQIVEVRGGAPRVERIATAGADSGQFGYLEQIRSIDGELFVCGYRRQVYRLDANQWTLISKCILDNRPLGPWNGFSAIDGFSKTDVYAVGDEGEIWHFDGARWRQCNSPTNQNLADVRCLGGKVWICGDAGILLSGDRNGWTIVWDDSEPSENWWSIEEFAGHVYLAGNEFLGRIESGQIVAVTTPVQTDVTTHRLHARDGLLWSVGEEHILVFDGNSWREIICPQNP